ncbi:MAG: hypothetical protein A2008_00860 [Candidatus Wallbacteria bacterium GWC2_49_35]|uniref:Calcineurin-like phosphoesterase domain-containing protein n=1 Tax=Candidatus Wallbacteria bacterium GWC2_49_35 TaxID=1817813 RepID=A0A1F7WQW4_9BACT|nr:MAG: hypothetical protein A2008_00860 [Candidatus Wallbacteria bacterium GWC2_49_35]HBC75212.1 hypothetical protein [Candidatus Wallbacteria bacterium]
MKNKKILLLLAALFSFFIFTDPGSAAPIKDKSIIEIDLIHTNDTHGNLQKPFDGGATLRDLVSGHKNMIVNNKKDANTLTLDAGDITSYKDVCYETMESDIRALDALGYDAMTIGNHEIDFGLYKFHELSKTVKMPVLCANFIDNKTKTYLFRPYILKTFAGTRIAIAGITASNTFTALSDDEKKMVTFLNTDEAYLKIRAELKEKADIIILLSHLGLPDDREFAKKYPEVKLIIGGHSHTFLNEPEYAGKTCILNAGKFGDCFGRAKIKIVDKEIMSVEEQLINLKKTFPKK